MMRTRPTISRRLVLGCGVAVLAATGGAVQTAQAQDRRYALHVSRDAGCGCCHAWAELMRRSGRFDVTLLDVADMAALKRRLGVPAALASCHTATVQGFVIEGHVPTRDILRLIEAPPRGVEGLAVPGMPIGSPGMEQAGPLRDAFDVLAFGAGREPSVFAHYPARSA